MGYVRDKSCLGPTGCESVEILVLARGFVERLIHSLYQPVPGNAESTRSDRLRDTLQRAPRKALLPRLKRFGT